jgi:hypothetical protein
MFSFLVAPEIDKFETATVWKQHFNNDCGFTRTVLLFSAATKGPSR